MPQGGAEYVGVVGAMTARHTSTPWVLEPNGAAFNLRHPDNPRHHMILVGMTYLEGGEHEENCKMIQAALDQFDKAKQP